MKNKKNKKKIEVLSFARFEVDGKTRNVKKVKDQEEGNGEGNSGATALRVRSWLTFSYLIC